MAKPKSFAKALAERADAALAVGQQEAQGEDIAHQQASLPIAPTNEPVRPSIEFRKFTVPLRSDQLDLLSLTVARMLIDHGVDLSKAVLIRYALSTVLAQAKDDPDRLLQALQQFETEELAMNADRKYSISAGLQGYKVKRGPTGKP